MVNVYSQGSGAPYVTVEAGDSTAMLSGLAPMTMLFAPVCHTTEMV